MYILRSVQCHVTVCMYVYKDVCALYLYIYIICIHFDKFDDRTLRIVYVICYMIVYICMYAKYSLLSSLL